MSPAINELRRLPLAERIQLVEELWDTIAEETVSLELTPEHRAELDRRLDNLESQPQAGTPWGTVRERILAGL